MQEPVVRRKPFFAIGVAAAIVVVVAAALYFAYGIFDRSYNGNIARLKTMVQEAAAQFEAGDTAADASPADQIRFYRTLDAQIGNLSQTLTKLNGAYTLLFEKETDKGMGITALREKMDALKPGLDAYRECSDEDGSIAAGLAGLLGSAQGGTPDDYEALSVRNEALALKIGGLSFFGGLETSRSALSQGVGRRKAALEFLMEDADVNVRLAALLEDVQSKPADLLTGLTALLQENDVLTGKAAEANVKAFGSGGVDVDQMLAARKQQLTTEIAYYTELQAVEKDVLALNGKMEKGIGGSGTFTARLALWSGWIKDVNTLVSRVKVLHAKPEFASIAKRRTLASLGLSPDAQALPSQSKAILSLSTAVSDSNAVEKRIDALLKDQKYAVEVMTRKVTELIGMQDKNAAIIGSVSSLSVPENLAGGLTDFIAGCTERDVFLEEFIGYVKDNAVALGQKDKRNKYLQKYEEFKNTAMGYPPGPDRDFWMQLANDNRKFADTAYNEYKTAMSSADKHKKAYEASRKKYRALLD